MKRNKKENFLDYVPVHSVDFEEDQNKNIVLLIPRFKSKIAKKLFSFLARSEFIRISLDETGSTVWRLIDGKRSVFEITNELKHIKKDINQEKIYERVSLFISTLARNRFVKLK